jgi:hypothetical protein
LLQRKCACGAHTPGGETCSSCAAVSSPRGRLSIGPAGDSFEREADRVAEQVLAGPASPSVARAPVGIQRFASYPAEGSKEVPASVGRTLGGGGNPLDAATRGDMQRRFGHDFSAVRVHHDGAAAQSARDMGARAYTAGSHIVFGAGQFSPGSQGGRWLLAHELTHVVQQGAGTRTGVIRRAPADTAQARSHRMGGGVLPYREATELAACIRIMGAANAQYCREQVLSEPAPQKLTPGQILAEELQTLIDGATWPEIRKRLYPQASAPGIQKAKERRAGTQPDLTGLGRVGTLDLFAGQIKALQGIWAAKSPDDRLKEVRKITDVRLDAADVPRFRAVDREVMTPKGFFEPAPWRFVLSNEFVGAPLDNENAGELANTTLHESRHAEQHFLSARFAAGAGAGVKSAEELRLQQGIHGDVAKKAWAKKFDAKTDPAVAATGKRMFGALVTDERSNQKTSDNATLAIKALDAARSQASAALARLKTTENPATIAAATVKRDALVAKIADVESKYKLYRNIPYEADAHEVGDAAQEAFKALP